MARLGDVLTGHEERLPEVGKYNAGQKMVFWVDVDPDHRPDLSGLVHLGPVLLAVHDDRAEARAPC